MVDDTQIQHELAVRDQFIFEVKPITCDGDREALTRAYVHVKDWLDRFTVIEKDMCDPIYRAWKNAKDRFKEGRAPAEKFKDSIDHELQADRRRQQEAIAKEQKRLNDLAQKRFDRQQAAGKPTPLPVPVAAIVQDTGKRVATDDGTVTWVDNYVPVIVNADLLPREYMVPDWAKLKAAAKAKLPIPGVAYQNEPYQKVTRG